MASSLSNLVNTLVEVIQKIKCKQMNIMVQSGTLLLAAVFENFLNMWFKIYEREPACFLTALELEWPAALNRPK